MQYDISGPKHKGKEDNTSGVNLISDEGWAAGGEGYMLLRGNGCFDSKASSDSKSLQLCASCFTKFSSFKLVSEGETEGKVSFF